MVTVLIYPYWNVKASSRTLSLLAVTGFNLSILECKALQLYSFSQFLIVLIYPYWNVKSKVTSRTHSEAVVLIYPYWNVKIGIIALKHAIVFVLIYPYWNVKYRNNCFR